MEIILSKQCKSLTGSLGRGFGYYIKSHLSYGSGKERFFSQRCSKGSIPPDGHWRFILACAELANIGLHIADIKVSQDEVRAALLEAGHHTAMWHLKLSIYDARDILNLKTTFGL